jgi:hypothetical protein
MFFLVFVYIGTIGEVGSLNLLVVWVAWIDSFYGIMKTRNDWFPQYIFLKLPA